MIGFATVNQLPNPEPVLCNHANLVSKDEEFADFAMSR